MLPNLLCGMEMADLQLLSIYCGVIFITFDQEVHPLFPDIFKWDLIKTLVWIYRANNRAVPMLSL